MQIKSTETLELVIHQPESELCESPVWDAESARLLWVDIAAAARVHSSSQTANYHLTRRERSRQLLADALFRCRPGLRGLPSAPYSGCRSK
jgi:sugar lactone lactonase YvrE